MKNKLKKFLLLFGVISTILVACNFDETHDHFHSENGKKSNFKIQKVKSEIFSKNTQLIGKLNTNKQLLKSIDSNNRIITSSDNSFYINTEEATYIEEENGLHSYTFFINRNLDNVFLENLLISSQEDGTYKSFIVRYNISAQEVEDLKNGINIDTNNRISIEIIDDVNFTQGISNKIIYTPCVTGTNKFWQCSNNVAGHMPGNPGPPRCSADSFSYVINVQWGLCASDDGTMDDISGGGGSSDGGGGGSTTSTGSNYDGSNTSIHGNGSNSLNTAPMAPVAEIENPLDCVTKEKLHEIFPSSSLENRTKLADNIRIYGGYFGINTKEEVSHFLAQVGAETGGLTTLNATENLNYTTASRLVQVFPSKFSLLSHPTKVSPIPYLNNPSGLANLVYCCQYGNGDVTSGDGWKYRGRGVLQLTWKGNYLGYENYLNDIGLDWFYYGPDNLSDINGIHSVLSGMWFFKRNVLDKMTINNTTPVKKVTKKINPALKKLNERKNYFNKAINVLNC